MNTTDSAEYRRRPDPREWWRPEMRVAWAGQDVTRAYRLLQKIGYSQHHLAALTGQAQPEVSAIIHGKRLVLGYDVLRRITIGLGVPLGLAGLAYCDCGPGCPHEQPVGIEATARQPAVRLQRRRRIALLEARADSLANDALTT